MDNYVLSSGIGPNRICIQQRRQLTILCTNGFDLNPPLWGSNLYAPGIVVKLTCHSLYQNLSEWWAWHNKTIAKIENNLRNYMNRRASVT